MNLQKAQNRNSPDKVYIYLRNSQKRAHYLPIPSKLGHHQLSRIVSEAAKVPEENLVLFHKGERLTNQQEIIELKERNIIHFVDLKNTQKNTLNIHIKRLHGTKTLTHHKITSNTPIKNFIDSNIFESLGLNSDQVFLVYTGKQLDLEKTFFQQYVEDQSELICINFEEGQSGIPAMVTPRRIQNKRGEQEGERIELGPGKTYAEIYKKKPLPGHPNAPQSEQQIAAPSNVVIKKNIPKQSNPEDQKKEAPIPSFEEIEDDKEEYKELKSGSKNIQEESREEEREEVRVDPAGVEVGQCVSDVSIEVDEKGEPVHVASIQTLPIAETIIDAVQNSSNQVNTFTDNKTSQIRRHIADGLKDLPFASEREAQFSGTFQRADIPLCPESVQLKAGDLIYSGELHLYETENLMADILNDYQDVVDKSQQTLREKENNKLLLQDGTSS